MEMATMDVVKAQEVAGKVLAGAAMALVEVVMVMVGEVMVWARAERLGETE